VEGGKGQPRYLADWVLSLDPEDIIRQNPELNRPALYEDDEAINAVAVRIKRIVEKSSVLIDDDRISRFSDTPTSIQSASDTKGGVDFRALPIVTEPLNTPRINMPLSSLNNFRADPEWQEIQNMVNAGIIPSGQRIKDYLQACCKKKELNGEIGVVLNCIADIMRIEEGRVSATDPEFKDMLVLLESGKSAEELKTALDKINFQSEALKRNP
jgi:hypothetical protein